MSHQQNEEIVKSRHKIFSSQVKEQKWFSNHVLGSRLIIRCALCARTTPGWGALRSSWVQSGDVAVPTFPKLQVWESCSMWQLYNLRHLFQYSGQQGIKISCIELAMA